MFNGKISQTKSAVCPTHGEFERFDVRDGEKVITGACPQCDREESITKAREEREEAANLAKLAALSMSGIPKRFLSKTFANYVTDNAIGKQRALTICKAYCDNFETVSSRGTGMILCGRPGTGKTHLACAIGNSLVMSNKVVLFIGAYRAIQKVKDTYSRKSDGLTEQAVIDNFSNLDLLILDEIGVQYGSDAERLILFEIINRRYEQVRPTILISNLGIDELSGYVGDRVRDRMKEGAGPVVAFDWESERR